MPRSATTSSSTPRHPDSPFLRVDGVTLAYAQGLYRLTVKTPLETRQLTVEVVDDAEAILQGYGRGLGETVFLEPDGSLLHAGWRFERTR